jgi:hypothetical protein
MTRSEMLKIIEGLQHDYKCTANRAQRCTCGKYWIESDLILNIATHFKTIKDVRNAVINIPHGTKCIGSGNKSCSCGKWDVIVFLNDQLNNNATT